MSFLYGNGTYPNVPDYGYGLTSARHITWRHFVLATVAAVALMTSILAYLVTSNLKASSEPLNSSGLSSQPAQPASPIVQAPLPDNSPALQTDINNWVAAQKNSTWAVDVQALDGNLRAGVNSERTFSLASIYKLFLVQPLAQKIPSSSWNSKTINGRSYTACVDAMLRVSDNPCAEAIGTSLGWSKIDAFLGGLGFTKTRFALSKQVPGNAHETAIQLQSLYSKNGIDDTTYSVVMAALAAPKRAEGIRHGCNGCKVFNKTGEFGAVRHDAAIIEVDGKAYSVVILSEGGSWQQVTNLTHIIASYL